MATPLCLHGYRCFPRRRPHSPFIARLAARFVLALAAATLLSAAAFAQFTQPLVFSSNGAVVVRDDSTGALTPVAGSPFVSNSNVLAIDVQGRYLFGIGSNSIRMFVITDSSTGAYQEVANSPFASPNTNTPIFIAVEPTGNYIAVVNQIGPSTQQAGAETFQISPNASGGPALIPVTNSYTILDSTVVGVSQPANSAKEFYLYLGPQFPTVPNFPDGEELDFVSIDSQTGLLLGISSANVTNSTARSYAADPQGRYIITGHGEYEGLIQIWGIGKDAGTTGGISLGVTVFPGDLWVDSTGTFLYARTSPAVDAPVHIYSLNTQTFALTETASSPLPGATTVPSYQPDPTGPFNYGCPCPSPNTLSALTVDPVTGYFVQTANSPFTIPGVGSLTFSIVPGSQGISGPSIQIAPTNLSLGTLQVGTPSTPQMITLTSNGAEALSINSIVVSGADASEFLETDTCQTPAVLQPNKFCSVSITFTPASPGPQSATLMITDNAPGSPQSVSLSGAGVAPPPPAPVATIASNPANFATITQGTTSSPMTITLTNTGNATLHISSVVVGGNNPGDFANAPSNCSGAALAANAACTFSVTFAPLAAGQRTETITVSDDAANSPQLINVAGFANPAAVVAPAPTGSTTASVTPGATAQYQLQITPGANFSGAISLLCSGAPLGAVCQLPSTVQVTNGAAAMFTVMITTSGGAMLPPASFTPWNIPPRLLYPAASLFLFVGFLAVLFLGRRTSFQPFAIHRRLPITVAAACATLAFATLVALAAGCGGNAAPAPPPLITPQGTSNIVVTPSAKSASGQTLLLAPIQLTLTVN